MQVRNGKLIGREHFIVEGARDVTDAEVLGSFLQQYYATTDALPRALLVPVLPADADDLAAYLADRRGVRVTVTVPERGEKRRLVGLATQNAVEALERERTEGWPMPPAATRRSRACPRARPAAAAGADRVLRHEQHPGDVGGRLMVFIDGKPEPREYRRFRSARARRPTTSG